MGKKRHGAWVGINFLTGLLVLTAAASGCGKSESESLQKLLPDIPSSTTFGQIYPRLNASLSKGPHDAVAATRDMMKWANDNLPDFKASSCANLGVIADPEFTRVFGRSTLGVTLPWMQVYVRDGNREDEPYLWNDPSLFASTILHEFVHARQRAQQANQFLSSGDTCDGARYALARRQNTWSTGFADLRSVRSLSANFSASESSLIYRWISPIERARDEVEAAATTVRWMNEHSDELNAFTIGGVNNWVYGVQYLTQLRLLARSSCFSPEGSTYLDEKKIYNEEIPNYIRFFQEYEPGMRAFLKQHGIAIAQVNLSELAAAPTPLGRDGPNCTTPAGSELPEFPTTVGGMIRLAPIPID